MIRKYRVPLSALHLFNVRNSGFELAAVTYQWQSTVYLLTRVKLYISKLNMSGLQCNIINIDQIG